MWLLKVYSFMNHTNIFLFLLLFLFAGCNEKKVDKARNYFEAGKRYEELQQLDSAAVSYRQAADLLNETEDYELKGEICNRLGDVYLNVDLYSEACQTFREAMKCTSRLTDKTAFSKSLRGIGKSFAFRYLPDSAVVYCLKAFDLMDSVCDPHETLLIVNNLSKMCQILGQYDKALHYNTIALQLPQDSIDLCRNWLIRAKILLDCQQCDSARYYYEIGCRSKDIFTQAACYYGLYAVSSLLQQPDSAKYLKFYVLLNDSIDRASQSLQVKSSSETYRNHQISLKHKRKITGISLVFAGCLVIFIFLSKWYKKNLEKQKIEDQEKARHISQLYKELNTLRQKHEFGDNFREADAADSQNFGKWEETYTNAIKNITDEATCCKELFLKSNDYLLMKEIVGRSPFTCTIEERNRIFKSIAKSYEPFIQYLAAFTKIALEDSYLCCLSLSGLTLQESAKLRGVSYDAVRSQKTRIKKKFSKSFLGCDIFTIIFR